MMNTEQKAAWYTLVICLAALVCFAVLLFTIGFPAAMSAFALLAFTGFTPLLFTHGRGHGEVLLDERDRLLLRKANVIAGTASYLAFVVSCMIAWFIPFFSGAQHVDISILPLIVFGGGITLMMVRAISVIVLYGRGGDYAEG